ncbi:BQ5605_C001g00336 [Microbotryum silenes-dioicae]|uniref:BQ5605_C001g00336 protein n=1 Tax=Microbotryum silenes-dioicae TaxID=796604 RepID=A0A2X0P5V7_9BASI|nr:BQ5605_C001g00336 [Microbotryum silenes-dioicae]
MKLSSNPIPFRGLCGLIDELAKVPARPTHTRRATKDESKRQSIVRRWIQDHKDGTAPWLSERMPPGTIVLWFRMMYPEEGVRRRYSIGDTTMAAWLADYLDLRKELRDELSGEWSRPDRERRAGVTGCLGLKISQSWPMNPRSSTPLTLGRIDELLDELAAKAGTSADRVRSLYSSTSRTRNRDEILRELFDPLTEREASIMVQIILQDMSPIFYPLPTTSSTAALLKYNARAHERLTAQDAMALWHERMPDLYRIKADIDEAATEVERALRCGEEPQKFQPRLGIPILVPRTNKPQACEDACRCLSGRTAVETKYDGERVQAHIDLSLPIERQVQIFSKSCRDSTKDRYRLIPIIRASLGLTIPSVNQVRSWLGMSRTADSTHGMTYADDTIVEPRLLRRSAQTRAQKWKKLVLEGEMVPFDENTNAPAPFYTLVYAKSGRDDGAAAAEEDAESAMTGSTQEETPSDGLPLHLHIVWFELLVLDDISLLDTPFSLRRVLLKKLINEIQGFSSFPETIDIDFADRSTALEELRSCFAQIITERKEGLMLKPLTGVYNELHDNRRWIKLKKDFIPGCGDTIDVHVLGASWKKERGRDQLGKQVPTTVYTTFFIGFLASESPFDLWMISFVYNLQTNIPAKPHYVILSASSYGYQGALDRKRLCELNSNIMSAEQLEFSSARHVAGEAFYGDFKRVKVSEQGLDVWMADACPYTFSLSKELESSATMPWIIFTEPRVFEIVGAGFQKERGCKYHALRWPRIAKVDRTDGDPVDLEQLQAIAHHATDSPWAVSELFTPHVQLCDNYPDQHSSLDSMLARAKAHECKKWVAKLEEADKIERPTFAWNHRMVEEDDGERQDKHIAGPYALVCQAFGISWADLVGPASGCRKRPYDTLGADNSVKPRARDGSPPFRLDRTAWGRQAPDRQLTFTKLLIPPSTAQPLTPLFPLNVLRASNLISEAESESSGSPTRDYAWSVLPAPEIDCTMGLPGPCHLKNSNYYRHPLHVLWAAGWSIPGYRPLSRLRQGVIYVESEHDIDFVRQISSHALPSKDKKLLWFIDRRWYGHRTSLQSLSQSNGVLQVW